MKKSRIKFFKFENLIALSVNDVFRHVQLLYKHIARQKKRMKRLKLEMEKIVSLQISLL